MISVAEAQALLLGLVDRLSVETVPLRRAAGRVLAEPVAARSDQPPFAASAMDGYAIATTDAAPGQQFTVVGEAAAGHPFSEALHDGTAVRIFTGAPLPPGAKRVIIQEDVTRDGDTITLGAKLDPGHHIRPAAGDFAAGDTLDPSGPLGARQIALLAAMGHGTLPLTRRPRVAILMTGDELRMPGDPLQPGQITASNGFGLAAMVERAGAEARLLPLARDTTESLTQAIALAGDADLLITIGGASVGDHDLVSTVLQDHGIEMSFHKVAMRPGKPLMAGRLGKMAVVGLPGNPVSAMVCATIFVLPMVRKMLGLDSTLRTADAPLAQDLATNGPREHYMRGTLDGAGAVHVAAKQDSSLLTVLADSNVLVIRPPRDPARSKGEQVRILPLDD